MPKPKKTIKNTIKEIKGQLIINSFKSADIKKKEKSKKEETESE